MIATRTILLFSFIQLAGCSNLGADSGGISSGGDHPSPAPSTTAQGASTDSGSGPADTTDSSTGATTSSPAASTATTSTAAGSGSASGDISIAASILANAPAGTTTTAGSLSGGIATTQGSGTTAGVEAYVLCQAQISTSQVCQISNYGVSINGAAATAALFTSDLTSTAAVLASVTTNSMSSSAYISNTSAAWCAVQTSSGTYYQVTGLSSSSALPWVTDLITFLQLNCLSSGH